jgi:hypothetical protein
MVDGDSFQRGQKMSAQQIYTLCKGADGQNVLIQNSGTYIQWKLQSDAAWMNLIALSSLKGADGKQLEIQVAGGYIQTRLTGGAWASRIAIADLKGDKGDDALPPVFSFQITALAPNAAPTASVTGAYPNLTVALGIPRGQDAALPNIGFSISALGPDDTPTAQVTGVYPNLIVALGIPRGHDAAAPAFTFAAEAKEPGTMPELTATGVYPNIALTFKIPKGMQGNKGEPLVVLPNGNYGNWDNGLNQYVDSGVPASATLVLETTPVQFTEAEIRANIQSGEGITSLFGKIKKWFSDLGNLAFKNTVDWLTDVVNKPVNVSDFSNDAGYQNAQQVSDAVGAIDLSPYEQTVNKVAINSQATDTQYPTARSVWELIQDVLATIPSGGLKVPLSIDLESDLPDPETLEPGDYFFIQNMDVTADEHTGRAWVNYTEPADTQTPLKYYKVTDQYYAADNVSIVQTGGGSLEVSTAWLNQQIANALANYVQTSRTIAGLDLSANRTAEELKTALGITESLTVTDRALLDFIEGYTTVTTLTNINVSVKQLIIATVSTNQSLSLTGVPPSNIAHVLVKNSSASAITVAIPTTGAYKSRVGASVDVPANNSIEISILYDPAGTYIITSVEDE